MENHNKPRGIVHGFVHLIEYMEYDTAYHMEKAVQKPAVFKEELLQVFMNSEYTMPVLYINYFERHAGSSFHRIFCSACGAETAVAPERDKFKISTVGTPIHGTTTGRVSTVNHFFNIFHFTGTWMEGIFNFFVMVSENFL